MIPRVVFRLHFRGLINGFKFREMLNHPWAPGGGFKFREMLYLSGAPGGSFKFREILPSLSGVGGRRLSKYVSVQGLMEQGVLPTVRAHAPPSHPPTGIRGIYR
jgi:hypothetical protein